MNFFTHRSSRFGYLNYSATPPGVVAILAISGVVFLFQQLFLVYFQKPVFENVFALSSAALRSGFIWTPLSYGFLHGSFLHLLVNMLVIFFTARTLEPYLGTQRFLWLYLSSMVCGGAFWLVLGLLAGGPSFSLLVGASSGAFGLMAFFCLLQPEKPVTLLLFFVLPITLKPKWILRWMVGIEFFLMLFYELPGRSFVASSAHLGGITAGCLMFFILQRSRRYF